MCYRTSTPEEELLNQYLEEEAKKDGDLNDYTVAENYPHYYQANGFSHPFMPVTTTEEPHKINSAIWGLIPGWFKKSVKEAEVFANNTLNAVSERIFETASYKNYIGKYRCLIWVDGFYEWKWLDNKGKEKIPYYIYMPSHKPFTLGGLYSHWVNPDTGEVHNTMSIITTDANSMMAEIHNSKKRMPLVIAPNKRSEWLSQLDKPHIEDMMKTYPDDILQSHTISKLITSRTENPDVPEVQEKFEYNNSLF